MEKEVHKLPPARVITGYDEEIMVEQLEPGRRRVTVFRKNKEIKSYIEDDSQPAPWWKFW